MPAHAITLHLPETLYQRLRQRAEWSHRSLEAEVLDAVASGTPVEGEIPPEILASVEALEELPDDELWRVARTVMSQEASQELEALHAKQREGGLTEKEDTTRRNLLQEYEKILLTRAQAAKLLKDRGHDISGLLGPQ
jgi:plasmid stability protein